MAAEEDIKASLTAALAKQPTKDEVVDQGFLIEKVRKTRQREHMESLKRPSHV